MQCWLSEFTSITNLMCEFAEAADINFVAASSPMKISQTAAPVKIIGHVYSIKQYNDCVFVWKQRSLA